jgi:outer membrane protein
MEQTPQFAHSILLMANHPISFRSRRMIRAILAGVAMAGTSSIAAAQQADIPAPAEIDSTNQQPSEAPTQRTRIYLGPQLGPAYPGADRLSWGPFFDISRARAGEYFPYEAPDESPGFNFFERGGSALGVAFGFVGKRKAKDVDGMLPTVGGSFELGLSGQTWVLPNVRLRAEARKAVSGHDGFVGNLSADYVVQKGDDLVLSIGPRLSLGDGKFARRYFGVSERGAELSGLPAYRPKGGINSIGAAASVLYQLDRTWGVAAYARYDRLVGDAASSPVTREFGSRHQPSVGVALSYTFASNKAR